MNPAASCRGKLPEAESEPPLRESLFSEFVRTRISKRGGACVGSGGISCFLDCVWVGDCV